MFVWTWDSIRERASRAMRVRMTRWWRNTLLAVALIGTVIAAVVLYRMHVDWVAGTVWCAVLTTAVAVGLRPQDLGWPPRVRIRAAELIAWGLSLAGLVGGVLLRRASWAAAETISKVEVSFDLACRMFGRGKRQVDGHVGVYHVALLARAVPAPRFCRALAAAA